MRETRLWLLSMACGVLLILLVGAHFAVMHYTPLFVGQSVEEFRSFEAMMARGRQMAQFAIYILFLAVALYHGLYGLRGILLELPSGRQWSRSISLTLLGIGLAFFAYGSYVTWWTFVGG